VAIEPMVNVGGPKVKVLSDDWTAVSVDGSLSAHFEHTVVVSGDGCEILTLLAADAGRARQMMGTAVRR
jgi:methionyl aminopeptidase